MNYNMVECTTSWLRFSTVVLNDLSLIIVSVSECVISNEMTVTVSIWELYCTDIQYVYDATIKNYWREND